MFKSYRNESRSNYGRHVDEGANLSNDDLKVGAILRIADATEAMAKNHVQLQSDLDWYKDRYNRAREEADALRRRVNALRGAITKLKAKK
ncbi:hypothetical protein R82526_01543 [Ralstonia mannitolilytica]|uniref:hypothetical protein n=1 Tax=Ralstonia mannitolilytica TaxID=105219 RepID=UPI000AC31868|nr:hypothetical protein [Ralstonia mannitolilytica]CAJ0682053.1 hypothetical protein R82526_01543 [Ralstonia mannitolilytica]